MPHTDTDTDTDLKDWVTLKQLAKLNPAFPLSTLNYLARAEERKKNGFGDCLRFVTSKKPVISLSRFAVWVTKCPRFGGRNA